MKKLWFVTLGKCTRVSGPEEGLTHAQIKKGSTNLLSICHEKKWIALKLKSKTETKRNNKSNHAENPRQPPKGLLQTYIIYISLLFTTFSLPPSLLP